MEDSMIKDWTSTKTETDEYLERLEDELNEKLNGITDCPLTAMEIIQHALMLTQYQRRDAGVYEVNYDDFTRYVIDEVMEEPTVDQVNMYLEANCYDDDIFHENIPEVLNDVLSWRDPWDICDLVHFGDWNPTAPYFGFDGYGNLKAWEENEIISMYGRGTKRYLFETSQYDDSIEDIDYCSDVIIEYCNRMLRDGF
jgi:hypothetical protein